MATIALVDDDRNILTSVSIALESEGYRVETYTDGASALEGFAARPPNLAILDIKMPRMDGMELLRRLRQKTDLPVIFLTSKDDEIDELFGLKMGADDFIRKPFSQRLLVERVRAVLRRASAREAAAKTPTQQSKSLERGQLVMDQERHTCTWKGEPVTLTVTEFLILHSLAQRPGVVKSRDALMDSAYDEQVYVDDRTIDSHIKRLRKKFKAVDDDFEMIETLYGVGYRFREAEAAGIGMAIDIQLQKPVAAGKKRSRGYMEAVLGVVTGPLQRFLGHHVFSSLTRRILFLNLAGLAVLVAGILYLNTFRDGLIDARVESLMTQGEIIAGAVASSATVETDSISIDPEKLLELQAGESLAPGSDQLDNLDFPINPERVAPLLKRLISPTRTRARIYDRDANLLLDSRHLYSRGQILRYDLPPVDKEEPDILDRVEKFVFDLFRNAELPVYREQPGGNGAAFPEVMNALTGSPSTVVRVSEKGEEIVSVAVPIQRFRAVLGVLMLSTEGGDIDKIVAAERKAILRVFGVAALVMAILSMLLASTIANPLRRLSAAAVRVRRGVKSREEIPDFSDRQDEIGNLSVAVRGMTNALYARIEAIESFAADVAHELKNPLTSLRSAVETLPLAKNESSRSRLMEIIQHDVRRLDRLITDISDASRLDAELAREDAAKVDLRKLVTELVSLAQETTRNKRKATIEFKAAKLPQGVKGYFVTGHDLRLGQVVTNLVENARSFIPEEHGHITVTLERVGKFNIISVEDNGPGIRPEAIDRIFERFYTDRPSSEAFGQNSGLGLSISRQIAEAHGGKLTAENIPGIKPGEVKGARFVITLPAEG